MKRLRYSLLAVLALVVLAVSCVDPLEPVPGNQSSIPDDALVFSPKVLGITPATKTTPGETDRGENTVTRLDVFVYKTTGGTSSFHKHYQIGDGSQAIQTGVDYLLESNWRTNYTLTDTYRIYAIANINANKLNTPVLPASPTEAELLSLTSESDATIAGQYGYTCYDIVRLKNPDGTSPAAESLDHHIGNKLFLMDGKIDNWQVNQTAAKQYFTKEQDFSYPLSRAAAKFRVKLDFSGEFKTMLGTASDYDRKFTKVIEYWDPDTKQKPKVVQIITIGKLSDETNEGSVVTGGPRLKFANFLKATYDIAPPVTPSTTTTPTAAQLTTFRDANLWDSQNFYEFSYRTPAGEYGVDGFQYPYIDTTYSYAFSWEAGKAAEKAPAVAVSIVYTTYTQNYNEDGTKKGDLVSDGGVTNYYRIPLVDINKAGTDAINSIERNYYYQVEAQINTMGTSSTEIVPTRVKLNYRVIPWPYAPDEITDAQTTQLQYFVAETSYRLRGDGAHGTTLQYFTPKSNPIETGSNYNEYTPKIKNIEVYYKDQNDVKHTLASASNPTNPFSWSTSEGGDVSISVVPARDKKGGGDFHVSSTSLANRSVRYIEFDAYVDFGGGNVVTHHFVVTHFPLDNIQSISGAWSSRWNSSSSSTQITEYSFNPSADGWDSYDGYTEDVECSFDEYNAAEQEHRSTETQTGTRTSSREDFLANVTTNDQRTAANSESNAINGYWGTNPSYVSYTSQYNPEPALATASDNWDYWSPYYNGYYDGDYNKYKYSYYYTNASVTTYKARRYYRTVTVSVPSTGRWVDWDRDEGQTYNTANAKYTYDGSAYQAKVYYNGRVYPINVTRSGVTGNRSYTYNRSTSYNNAGNWSCYWTNGTWASQNSTMDLTNNHMYIIQISKAESGVILGRPRINNAYQSQDNVVSPAFMIASQLGAVSTFDSGADAATHCHTYMEVAENGYRFVDWRLPTASELAYIVGYQGNEDITSSGVFEPVITGISYYTLDGQVTNTYYPGATGTNRVRCVRDLTPAEVIELNETGTITAASY